MKTVLLLRQAGGFSYIQMSFFRKFSCISREGTGFVRQNKNLLSECKPRGTSTGFSQKLCPAHSPAGQSMKQLTL